jgi:hypothetical protein
MGFVELLLGVIFAAGLACGIGLGAMGDASNVEFWGARAGFIVAAIAVSIAYWYWWNEPEKALWHVIGLGAIAGLWVFVGLPLQLKWLEGREAKMKASATTHEAPPRPSSPNQNLSMEDLFTKDFSDLLNFQRALSMRVQNPANGLDTSVEVKIRLHYDFRSNTQFVSIYVPFFGDVRLHEGLVGFIDNLKKEIQNHRDEAKNVGVGSQIPGAPMIESKDLVFSGRVFLYTLNALNPIQIGQLVGSYRNDGLFLEIRGNDYLFFTSRQP